MSVPIVGAEMFTLRIERKRKNKRPRLCIRGKKITLMLPAGLEPDVEKYFEETATGVYAEVAKQKLTGVIWGNFNALGDVILSKDGTTVAYIAGKGHKIPRKSDSDLIIAPENAGKLVVPGGSLIVTPEQAAKEGIRA